MKVNFRELPALSRSNRVRAWAMVNPYCVACARTRTNPSSVIEQVASSGTPLEARVCTQPATRSWNSCWRKPNATRPFTSRRYFMGSRIKSPRPVCCSTLERLDPHSALEALLWGPQQYLPSVRAGFVVSTQCVHPPPLRRAGLPAGDQACGESDREERPDPSLKPSFPR
jgi:hypothetical protein